MSSTPEEGHVWFILYESLTKPPGFYLNLKIEHVGTLCFKPIKYLKYLAWCILGLQGDVKRQDGDVMNNGDLLEDKAIYIFACDGLTIGPKAINPAAFERKTSIQTASSSARQIGFKTELKSRDGYCMFGGDELCSGSHIVPFAKQDEWLQVIVHSRPRDSMWPSDYQGLHNINDVRNGMPLTPNIRHRFNMGQLAVLVTPNWILGTDDVPASPDPLPLPPEVAYLANRRYTLQWLKESDVRSRFNATCGKWNLDAAFHQDSEQEALPSALLLAYGYGAAAVKSWGSPTWRVFFEEHAQNLPRPLPAELPPLEPPQTINKNVEEIEETKEMDAWDLLLFFSVNNPAYVERCKREREEFLGSINRWRSQVT